MNIDFLKNKDGDFGLVSTGQLPSIITGIIFDHTDMTLSLEFDETIESLTLNIAVDAAYLADLTQKSQLFVIGTDKTHIHEAYSAPLIHINDLQDENVGEWR